MLYFSKSDAKVRLLFEPANYLETFCEKMMLFYVYNSIGYVSRGANLMFFIEYCYVTLACLMIIVSR